MAICNPFRNVLATNNDEWSDFANFDRKIGCHGNVHWAIREMGQIDNLRSNAYAMVKIW